MMSKDATSVCDRWTILTYPGASMAALTRTSPVSNLRLRDFRAPTIPTKHCALQLDIMNSPEQFFFKFWNSKRVHIYKVNCTIVDKEFGKMNQTSSLHTGDDASLRISPVLWKDQVGMSRIETCITLFLGVIHTVSHTWLYLTKMWERRKRVSSKPYVFPFHKPHERMILGSSCRTWKCTLYLLPPKHIPWWSMMRVQRQYPTLHMILASLRMVFYQDVVKLRTFSLIHQWVA